MDTEPLLLTPGPLTTSERVRRAMMRDWGSRDADFIRLNAEVCARLLSISGGVERRVCVPWRGSGTFAVEAMIATLVPPEGRLLVLRNGAYGARMVEIARRYGRDVVVQEDPEDRAHSPERLDHRLAEDPAITHVAVVHCETTTGLLHPLAELAAVVARRGRHLLVDAMSSFGALPLDVGRLPALAVAASANKCLEGVPGLAFVIVEREALMAAQGVCPSLALDLAAQYRAMAETGQYRFTPPTHVLAALREALLIHEEEGGVEGRGRRYRENLRVLVAGMRELGFRTLLSDELQAPIIVTFLEPASPSWCFDRFYDGLKRRGFAIYPGKLARRPSFRIGCIGRVFPDDLRRAVAAVAEVLGEMGVDDPKPDLELTME